MKNKEIEFEKLHSNKHRICLLCGIVCVVALMVTLIVTTSKAKYKTTESMPLLNGTINYTLADLNIVAMYLDGEQVDILPDGNYELTEDSYCTNEENVRDETITLSYDSATKGLSVSPMTRKGIKCYLYFEKGVSASETILASENAPTDQTTDWTNNGTGITYYYTGNPNNWVQFAGFYWRIIRINGDGSIRMIYQGVADSATPDSSNTKGTGTQIGTSAFNSSSNNNMYVGFKYTQNEVHGTKTNSTILGTDTSTDTKTLNGWYRANLLEYANYIDGNAGFCGDRTPSTSESNSNGVGGTGTTVTYYGAYIRLISNNNPNLQCDSSDVYTTIDSSSGNKSLQYPIGLITADEVILAGIPYYEDGRSQSNYLYTNVNYLTMSPFWYNSYASVFYVASYGSLSEIFVNRIDYGVRPVINLRNDVQITGSGTTSNPFKIKTS